MKIKMKTLLVVFVMLSAMTTAVNAGNIGPAIENTVTTLAEQIYQVTIAITSPSSDSAIYGTTSVNVGYATTNVSGAATKTYSLNGAPMVAVPSNPFTVTGVDDGKTDGGKVNTVKINVTDKNGTAEATRQFKVDITPPGNITGITSVKGTNYINWTWTNPTNSDFNNTIVKVTSGTGTIVPDTILPKEINYFNATGLTPNTAYTISVKTEDNAPPP